MFPDLQEIIKKEALNQLAYLRVVLNDAEEDIESKDIDEFNRSVMVLKCLTQFLNEDRGYKAWLTTMVKNINKKYSEVYDQYNSEH